MGSRLELLRVSQPSNSYWRRGIPSFTINHYALIRLIHFQRVSYTTNQNLLTNGDTMMYWDVMGYTIIWWNTVVSEQGVYQMAVLRRTIMIDPWNFNANPWVFSDHFHCTVTWYSCKAPPPTGIQKNHHMQEAPALVLGDAIGFIYGIAMCDFSPVSLKIIHSWWGGCLALHTNVFIEN